MRTKKINIIVGGGLAGMVSALLLKKKNNEVIIIEQNKKLGGLFRSRRLYKNLFFDYGSHFIKQTGVPRLDKLLFGELTNKNCHILGNLKGGSYFKNKLDKNSPHCNTKLLSNKIYNKGINEIFKLKRNTTKPINLKQQIQNNFGQTFLKEIFDPIINKKSFNCNLDKIEPHNHLFFGFSRIKAFDEMKSREIKKNKKFNSIFSFHHYSEGNSKLKNYYPKKGGAGLLVNLLEKKLKSKGIKILLNQKIEKVECKSKLINSVTTSNSKTIRCNKIVWTLNHNILCNYTNLKFKKNKIKDFSYISLHHLVFDKSFLTNNEYINSYDPNQKISRITLYPNICKDDKWIKIWKKNVKFFHLTAEVISPKLENLNLMQKKVISEIYQMGVISKNTKLKFKFSESFGGRIPIPTVKNLLNSKKNFLKLRNSFKNVIFASQISAPKSTGQLLTNIYNEIKNEKY